MYMCESLYLCVRFRATHIIYLLFPDMYECLILTTRACCFSVFMPNQDALFVTLNQYMSPSHHQGAMRCLSSVAPSVQFASLRRWGVAGGIRAVPSRRASTPLSTDWNGFL